MKKFISLAVAFCMILSLAMVPVSAETTTLTAGFEENEGTLTNKGSEGSVYSTTNGLLINSSYTYAPHFTLAAGVGYNDTTGINIPYGVLYQSAGYRGGTLQTKALAVGTNPYKVSYKIYFDDIAPIPTGATAASYMALGGLATGAVNKVAFWVQSGGTLVLGKEVTSGNGCTVSEDVWYTMETMVDTNGSTYTTLKDSTDTIVAKAFTDNSSSPVSENRSYFPIAHLSKAVTSGEADSTEMVAGTIISNAIIDDIELTTYDAAPIYDELLSDISSGEEGVSVSNSFTVVFDQPIINPEDILVYEYGDETKTSIDFSIENHVLNSFEVVPAAAQFGALKEYVIDCTALTNGVTASEAMINFTTENRAPEATVSIEDFDGEAGTINEHWSGTRYASANGTLVADPSEYNSSSGTGSFAFNAIAVADDGTGTNNVLQLTYGYQEKNDSYRGPALVTKGLDLSNGKSHKITYDIRIDELPATEEVKNHMAIGYSSTVYSYSSSYCPFYIVTGQKPGLKDFVTDRIYELEEDAWYTVDLYYTVDGVAAAFSDAEGNVICASEAERTTIDPEKSNNVFLLSYVRGSVSGTCKSSIDNVSITSYSKNIPPKFVANASTPDGSAIATVNALELVFDQPIANPEDVVIYADGDTNSTVDYTVEQIAGLKYLYKFSDVTPGDYVADFSALTNGTTDIDTTVTTLSFSLQEAEFDISSIKITTEGNLEIESTSDMSDITSSIITVGYTTNENGAKVLTGTHIVPVYTYGISYSSEIHEVISSADEVKSFVFYSRESLKPVRTPVDVVVEIEEASSEEATE